MSEERPVYPQREPGDVTVENLLSSLSTSNWLKSALRTALDRDVVDAANDAEVLSQVLSARAAAVLVTDAARLGIRRAGKP